LFLKVFSNVTDTGIPALIEHVHTTTKVRRRYGIEQLIRGVTHFILDIAGYLVEVGTQVSFAAASDCVDFRPFVIQNLTPDRRNVDAVASTCVCSTYCGL